jgi:transposase
MSIAFDFRITLPELIRTAEQALELLNRIEGAIPSAHDVQNPPRTLHGSARTTWEQRHAIQQSKKSQRELAKIHGVNPKTIAKWKKRDSVDDAPMGPTRGRQRKLTLEQEAEVVAYYKSKQPNESLDQCLSELLQRIPSLTRSTLYRCIQRNRDKHSVNHSGNSQAGYVPKTVSLNRDPFHGGALYIRGIARG